MSPESPDADRSGADEPGEVDRRGRGLTAALLVAPVLATLAVPVYAREEPRLSGVPFFYWYQFACVLLTAVCLAAAHWLGRPSRASGSPEAGRPW